ncbi:MAG: glycosyltransferase family 2 protein [Candidatus Binatia bacterium]|nr:glycosyltransferase family 2 protein [Candidatus Binatia bacterium]
MSQTEKSNQNLSVVKDLSVVLPAYNEEANIERVTREVASYLDTTPLDYEIIVVNDGSRDRTGEIIEALARELPRVHPQHHPQNRGYGAALRTGFAAARKRFVFYMDGDGQFDIRELALLLPLATDENHIVTGYRIKRNDPFIRRLNARLFGGWLVRILLNVRVRDLNCAFKLIPKKVLDAVTLESTGALINAELYGRAVRKGFGIKEVGVHHYPRTAGTQTGAHPKVILRAFYDLFRLRQKIVSEH